MLISLDRARSASQHKTVTFTRNELNSLAATYSTYVAKGIWRDYAIDFTKEMAAFSMLRHANETPQAAIFKLASNTTSGFLFEVVWEQKKIIRTPFLDRALQTLLDTLEKSQK